MPTVETNGASIYYEVHGDGPTVVFAHGRGGNAQEEGRQSEFWMLPGPDPEAPSVFDAVCFATRMTGTLSALLEE